MLADQLKMRCIINRSHIKAGVPATVFIAVDLITGTTNQTAQPSSRFPLNIGLAIDCSGSMQEESKLDHAQQAAVTLVRSLRPSDVISLVSFDTKARVEVPSMLATDIQLLERAIMRLPLGKETDLYEALRLVWEQTSKRAISSNFLSRIILLTDGEPTHGKTKEKDFIALAEKIRDSAIPVTTIGVGTKYNERLLMAIARATGSRWYHVSRPSFVNEIFADEMTQMASTVVRDPTLEFTLHEGAALVDAYTVRPMVAKLPISFEPHLSLKLKDIVWKEPQTVFFRVRISPKPPGQYPLADFRLGELNTNFTLTATDDEALANVEIDSYPRLLWVAGDGLTQVQRWIDGETVAIDDFGTRIRTIQAEASLPTVARSHENLNMAVTQLRRVQEELTQIAPGRLSEDSRKRLREEATVLRNSNQPAGV